MPTPILTTGTADFSGGVDSLKVATIFSEDLNPNGLKPNQLSKLVNGTMRDGALSPRDGWQKKGNVISVASLPYLVGQIFQGKTTYVPATGNPYQIWVVGGHVLKVDPDFITPPQDLSNIFNLKFPAPLAVKCYFCQASKYLVIQAGDFNADTGLGTLPLFWNGTTLTQSNGLTGIASNFLHPVEYGFTPISPGFVVPAVGGSVTFTTNTTYQGLTFATLALYAQAANTQEYIGTFQVTAATGTTMTLKTVSLSGSTRGRAGATIITACVLVSVPTAGGSTVTYKSNVFVGLGTPTSVSPNTIPPAGNSQTWVFGGGLDSAVPAPGTLITVYDLSSNVVGVCSISSNSGGGTPTVVVAWLFVASAIGTTLPYVAYQLTPTLTPATGNSFTIATSTTYGGLVNDTVFLSGTTIIGPNLTKGYQFGTYQVTTINANSLVLKALFVVTPGQPIIYDTVNLYTISSNSYQTTGSGLVSQLPAALSMAFYMGRIFYANGKTISGGDIIGGVAGTIANNFTDSVLSVTENPLSFGGDGFTMPSGSDLITGMAIPQMINASLGQGLLNIGTINAVFALQVPVTRADWIAANSSNQPEIFVVQQSNGFVNDWSIVGVNGDLWFQSVAPDIRSLLTAVRYFQQWANVSLSSNEDYILSSVNRSLLGFASGMFFNNRLWMTTLPTQTVYGIVHPAIIPLDMSTISTLEEQLPPNWEGNYEGLNIFQLTTAIFSGVQRAFSAVLSDTPGQFELWENVVDSIGDNGNRITWQATMPGFTFGKVFDQKKLVSAEMWLDQIQGVVEVTVEYCPDGSGCFYKWIKFLVCNASDSTQLTNPQNYPVVQFQQGIRRPICLPLPPDDPANETGRPANVLYEAQPRITFKGQARLRGLLLHAENVVKELYGKDMIQ